MPGERVNAVPKAMKRKAKHALDVNKKIIDAAIAGDLDEDSMTYGIITRNFGHGRMRLTLANRRETTALIRKSLRNKKATGMGNGDIVIVHLPNWEKEKRDALSGIHNEPESFIEGLVSKDVATILRDSGHLPDWMLISAGTNDVVIPDEKEGGGGYEFVGTATTSDSEEGDSEEAEGAEVGTASVSASVSASAPVTKPKVGKWARTDKVEMVAKGESFNIADI